MISVGNVMFRVAGWFVCVSYGNTYSECQLTLNTRNTDRSRHDKGGGLFNILSSTEETVTIAP